MKSGLSWNLRGIDEETREAVIEAARRSGLSVGQWLNSVLADDGIEHGEPDDIPTGEDEDTRDAAELAEAIERVTRRLGALDETARASITGLKDRLDEIEHRVSELSDANLGASEQRTLLRRVATLIDALARDIEVAAGGAESEDEPEPPEQVSGPTIDLDRITEAISDLDRRIGDMGHKMSAPPLPQIEVSPLRLDDIRDRLDALLAQSPQGAQPAQSAAIDAALKALESRIDIAKAQLEARLAAREAQAEAQATTSEQIGRIEERLTEIGQRIAAAEAERQKPKKEAVLSTAIREISAHQRAIDDRAETAAMRRDQKTLAAAMAALRNEIGALSEQVTAISRVGAEEHGAVFQLAQRMEALAADKPVDRNLLSSIRADLNNMRGMVESRARQETLGALEERHEDMAAQLGDLLRLAPDREKLEGLGDEVAALRQTLESDDSPRAIARLEQRVAELGNVIETTVGDLQQRLRHPDPAVLRLEGRLTDIAGDIEKLHQASAQTGDLSGTEERLHGRIDEIATRLGGLLVTVAKPQTAAIENVEKKLHGRLEEINTRLSNFADARLQTEAIEKAQRQLEDRLEGIVGRLGSMFDTSAQDAALSHVHERLQAITERIETLSASQREPSTALDAIKSEIKSLRAEIAGKETPAVNTDHLETQIRSLAEQLNSVSGSSENEAKALADLEAQVAHLAIELEQSTPRAADLKQVEERLDRLQTMLADTADSSIQSARSEARKAVDDLAEVVAGNEIDSGLVRGLMRDLDSLRSAAGSSDSATRSKLESVSATMTQVVERLSRLETETSAVASTPATRTDAGEPAVAKRDPTELLWKSGFRPAAESAPAKATEPPANAPEPTVKAHGPVAGKPAEPAKPSIVDLTPAPTAKKAPVFEKKPPEQRADFIAAARRAAQAAAQEAAAIEASVKPAADGAPERQPPGERKPGAFARISQAIRSRKRPLLLAAAAIVLAIGAMQLYGKVAPGVGDKALVAQTDTTATATATVTATVTPAPTPVPAPGPKVRDVSPWTAQALAPPGAAPASMVPPSAKPDAAIAFAPPMVTDSHFGGDAAAPPAADDESTDMAASASLPADDAETDMATSALPSADDASTDMAASAPPPADATTVAAADAAPDAAPVVLASAPVPAPTASTLDSRLGSQKLLLAAENGDPTAAFELATRYSEGSRIGKDLAKAAEWYEKAAEGGIAVAQYRLGSFYERGQGVAKDLVKAVNWYQRAADQGNVNAMHNLAVLMSEGVDGQPADHDKALQWFLAAANYGVRDSQYNLGVIYARGLGTAQDLAESYKWFAIAAKQGDSDAGARRDEVAKVMSADDLAGARAAVSAWHVKSSLAEANAVATPPGGWDGPTTITVADRQALVKKIQTLLADAGYDPGPADGLAGPKTVEAVRAYQRETGIPETGQIDHNLMASLSSGQ